MLGWGLFEGAYSQFSALGGLLRGFTAGVLALASWVPWVNSSEERLYIRTHMSVNPRVDLTASPMRDIIPQRKIVAQHAHHWWHPLLTYIFVEARVCNYASKWKVMTPVRNLGRVF